MEEIITNILENGKTHGIFIAISGLSGLIFPTPLVMMMRWQKERYYKVMMTDQEYLRHIKVLRIAGLVFTLLGVLLYLGIIDKIYNMLTK